MKGMILAASVLLAGCGGPRVTVTSADPHSVQLLVQSARLVPLQDIEDQGLQHCGDYGLVARRTQAEWISDTAMTFRFECVGPGKAVTARLADKKAPDPPAVAAKATVAKTPAERKQAAWTQANALSRDWHGCIVEAATKAARTSNERADAAALAVVAGCAQWERDVHDVLRKAGEDDSEFQEALHQQTIEFAADRIQSTRAEAAEGPQPVTATSQAAAR